MMEYKEHTKLYKSGKLWVAATIATTAVATGLVNTQTTAHADTTDQTQAVEGMSADQLKQTTSQANEVALATPQPGTPQPTFNAPSAQAAQPNVENTPALETQSEQPKQVTEQEQVASAKQDVATAQTSFDQASKQLDSAKATNDDAQAKLKDAQTDVAKNQAAVDSANKSVQDAQNLVNQATPEAISKLQDQIKADQSDVAKNKTNVANNQVTLDNANKALDQAKDVQTQAQNKVNAAQTDVNNAQKALDGTSLGQAQQAATNAQNQVNTAKQELAKATTDLANAQKTEADAKNALPAAKKDLENAKNALNNANADVKAKQSALDQANTNLKNSEAASQASTVQVPDVHKTYTAGQHDDIYAWVNPIFSTKDINNIVVPYTSDTDEYDKNMRNLPKDVRLELTEYAAGLINQWRKEKGLAPVTVNDASLALGQYQGQRAHGTMDVDAFDDANEYAKSTYGLSGAYTVGDLLYTMYYAIYGRIDGPASTYAQGITHASPHTMAGLKASILNVLSGSLSTRWVNEYAVPTNPLLLNSDAPIYLGLGFNDMEITYTLWTADQNATYKALYGQDSGQPNLDPHDLGRNYSEPADVSGAKNAQSNAQKDFDQAKNVQSNAQTKLDQAQNKVNDLQSKLNATSQAQQAKTNAENKLNQAKTDLDNANKQIQALSGTQAAKEAALKTAQQALFDAQANLNKANADVAAKQKAVDQAKTWVDTAKAELNKAETKLATDQEQLAKWEAAPRQLAQAKSDLAQAETALTNAKNVLAEAQSKADATKDAQAKAQADFDTAKTNLDKAKKNLQDLLDKIQAEHQQQADNGHYVVKNGQVLDGAGKPVAGWKVVNGLVYDEYGNYIKVKNLDAVKASVKFVAKNGVAVKNPKQAVKAKTLPQTGNSNEFGALGLASTMMLAALGMAGINKKRS